MTRLVETRFVIVRNGADFGLLYPKENAFPIVRMEADADVKTSLSGEFVRDDRIDWLSDKIRPELIIDGKAAPLGLFIPASVRWKETETTKTITLEAYDQCWQLNDTKTEGVLHFSAGTNYLTAVKLLLTQAGIALVSSTPTSATLTEDREDWEIGTSYLTIINQLLDEINFNPLWFNASGVAILEPASVPTAENIEHMINSDDPDCLMLPSITNEVDVFDAPNVFICVCSNPDKDDVMIARAENTNPQSALSIARRGRRIVHMEKVDNIASQIELQAYADRMRNESMITGETFRIQTALQPGHGVNDVVAFHHADVTAVCLERSWSMSLGVGGTMQHSLKKVVYNLG